MPLNIEQEKYLQDAFASARMEGLRITPEIERNTRRMLGGEISVDQCVREMLEKRTHREKS